MVPKSFGLKVVENVGDASLEGFYFEVKWLLEVKQVARRLSSAGVAKRVYPDIGCLKISQKICGLFGVNGCESKGL